MRKRGSIQWEDTTQKWYEWLEKMEKRRREGKDGGDASTKGDTMIESAEGSAGLPHKITKPTGMERRSKDPEERRRGCEVVGPL